MGSGTPCLLPGRRSTSSLRSSDMLATGRQRLGNGIGPEKTTENLAIGVAAFASQVVISPL